MIEVKNLSKSFPARKVLDNISVTLQQGKTNLIIGSSGSGKTTFIKCLVGLFEIDEGSILYDGDNFTDLPDKERREIRKKIGMVFQGGALFDSMTVIENVLFPLNIFSTMARSEKEDRANFCLQRVNILNANSLYPSEISGGMKKRVAIARAIAMNPRYLFFDEPNSGLDPQTAILIDQLIEEITEEYDITTVINTHDMNSVLEIGQNIIFLNQGKLHWEGNKEEILLTEDPALENFVYASNLFKQLRKEMIRKK